MAMLSLAQVAELVGGRLEGRDAEREVAGLAPLDTAGPTDLTYVVNESYARKLRTTAAAAALVPPGLDSEGNGTALIRVDNPELAFSRLLDVFFPGEDLVPGIHPTAIIGRKVQLGDRVTVGPYVTLAEGARVGEGTSVGAHAFIGRDVAIGKGCRIDPSCTVLEGSVLGDRVRLHTGVRIGVDGFGYAKSSEGAVKIPQVGRCLIGDDVEIGANTTIDRGSLGDTVIGHGTKIDNLVHIGHNCRVGSHCFIVAQVGLAGSCILEDGVQLGGQAGLAGHLSVGKGARVGAQGGVMTDIPAGETWTGYPARPHGLWLRASSFFYKLPELVRRLEALEQRASITKEGS